MEILGGEGVSYLAGTVGKGTPCERPVLVSS